MEKRWVINEPGEEETVGALMESLGVDRVIANLLVQRGITNFEMAKAFFRPSLEDLHDPFLMKDMTHAVDRLVTAMEKQERVMVYGDYDVDGTTSVALVYTYLKSHFDFIDYYIPDRYSEGYGISKTGIDYAAENNISLIIALDCGIKAIEKIAYASEKGVDFIICDHHTPDETLPDAVAVLDPKRSDCDYPCDVLSGCGVGFKLMQGLAQKKNWDFETLIPLLDLLAVSIASDIVPITGENRVLTYFGLKQLNESPRLGLKTILNLAGVTKDLSVNDIVFKIGPRINAAGRIQSGNHAVQLLIAEREEAATLIGDTINGLNEDRKELDHTITDDALDRVAKSKALLEKKSTVLFDRNWHKGVIGIVASRMIETYYKPTVILTESNGFATGSARSVDGFDLYNAISACSDLLENFGGHKYAAGLTMKIENVSAFQQRFEEYVCENITDDMLVPQIKVDASIKLSDITPKFFRILKQFEPFGPKNMTPVFISEKVVDYGYSRPVGRNKEHLKLSVVDDIREGDVKGGIAFSMGNLYSKISSGSPFDVCYSVQENEYMGKVETQLMVRDIKF
ncbi:single-stranded-DNA-specific exonuclease RecJ [Marinifilum caeruleilacunae]|uniref:Single-stranded-DNA-specific exonuclease RecJ n=1 Tax=Marinifilum caeruleilacunae TaxID=2499076 RepID=A0ABX1WRR7_9BACT|nr:single-stranded-DNA-specific exonuclease RecJ [Marinifilum caeruleilacunae]NOU58782.1 single-stranded-DNA-specific exonuclease RecJ [Marinifilum caeruleilacunae]